jgi:hypothetical protein
MISHSTQRRPEFTVSPLLVIAVIFTGLCIVEGLLLARFWLQFATVSAPDGIHGLVLDLTRPLVAPFEDAQSTAGASVGTFDRETLLAAMAYLLGAVALATVTILIGGLVSGRHLVDRKKRRVALQELDHSLGDHSAARLLGTASLSMSPAQATRALRMLHMDRSGFDFYVIPVSGGSVIAAFATTEGRAHWPIVGSVSHRREAIAVKRTFQTIERRFRPATTRTA